MKLDEIGYLKKLPMHRRAAIIGSCIWLVSGAIVALLYRFLGIESFSDPIGIFLSFVVLVSVYGLSMWYWGGQTPNQGTSWKKLTTIAKLDLILGLAFVIFGSLGFLLHVSGFTPTGVVFIAFGIVLLLAAWNSSRRHGLYSKILKSSIPDSK